jgi:hypothetical protein
MIDLRIPSSSALPLVHRCAASYAIPHGGRSGNDKARMGDALHEHMDHRAKYGITSAMESALEIARAHNLSETETSIFLARCRHFEWSPPRGSFGEVALCLLEDGTVVQMKGGKGLYVWPKDRVTGGTLDLMWSEPAPLDLSDPTHPRCPPGSVLIVPDVKSGEETYVEPVESNMQILTNAVLAAIWTGATRVLPATIFWRKGMGEWDVPLNGDGKARPWNEADMRRHIAVVRADMAAVREQQRKAAAGEPLDLIEGVQCTFCPARARCSLHNAQLQMIVTGKMSPVGDSPLTDHQRTWLADRLGAFEVIAKEIREVLRSDVEATGRPIPMSNENEWGPYPKPQTTILADLAMPILEEELGEHAQDVVERSISRSAIKVAAKAVLEERGEKRGVAGIERRIFAKFGEAGALVTEAKIVYGAHKPARANLARIDEDEELGD